MNMKWLTITICWSATTFPKSGTKKQDENAQYCTRPCHPEHTACVQDLCVWNPRLLTYFILDAEQTHCLIKQPQARGSVNMLARMTSGREQEAREKIFAELLLWNTLPTSKLRTFWIRPLELIGLNLVKSSGLDAKFSWTMLLSGLVGFLALIFLRKWFCPLIHFPLSGGTLFQERKKSSSYEMLSAIAGFCSLSVGIIQVPNKTMPTQKSCDLQD